MSDSEILRRMLRRLNNKDILDLEEVADLERIASRLQHEEEHARMKRAEDDTAPLGPVKRG